ncbi:MAG TPA: hypothetical protein VFR49_11260 [Solirubrobacteraceae bacterium]|nr:hypothetical protein [Solirubrobacteraceae bacterium]
MLRRLAFLATLASASARLRVRPGDLISARVTVRGRIPRLRMADATTGQAFSRSLRASAVDLSSPRPGSPRPGRPEGATRGRSPTRPGRRRRSA